MRRYGTEMKWLRVSGLQSPPSTWEPQQESREEGWRPAPGAQAAEPGLPAEARHALSLVRPSSCVLSGPLRRVGVSSPRVLASKQVG